MYYHYCNANDFDVKKKRTKRFIDINSSSYESCRYILYGISTLDS